MQQLFLELLKYKCWNFKSSFQKVSVVILTLSLDSPGVLQYWSEEVPLKTPLSSLQRNLEFGAPKKLTLLNCIEI